MGKRKFYISMVLTVGSLAWTMYSLPGQIEAVDAARSGMMPGDAVRSSHKSAKASSSSNEFDTIPDIDALLDIARANAKAAEHTGDPGLMVYAPDPDADVAALRAHADRAAPHKTRNH